TATQLAELDRDAEMLKVKVGSLVSKKAEAEITAELEAKSAPTEFRVLESATAPQLPASPNRPQMLLLALLAALALGTAVAVGQVAVADPEGAAAEQYRMLLHRLRYARSLRGAAQGGAVIAVTSAMREEGTSLTAANLALTAARAGDSRVALIDCDLRRGTQA